MDKDIVPFRTTEARIAEHAHTIAVEGELDLYTAAELKQRLREVDVENVLVDLSRVTFVDSAGLATLVTASRRVRARGGTLMLCVDDPNILKVLRVTGLDRFFDVRSSADDPVRELSMRPVLAAS